MQNLLDQLWELDKENSFARCTITPIKEDGELKFLWEQKMWIKPYPNPFSYGGFWAQGVAKTTEEVDRLITYFKSETEEWQKHGLCKIDIIRKPEMSRVEYQNDRRAEWLKRHGDDDKKAVESYYGEKYGIQGKDYLKKLVQVEFRLPPLRPQDVKDYTRILMHNLGQREDEASVALAEVVPTVIGDNPREVKRFINRVLLGTAIMRSARVTVPPAPQVAFMAMDFHLPGIMRVLSSDETVFKRIGAYIKAKAEGREMPHSEEEIQSVKTILENNPGLDSFLERSPGKELLVLNMDELNQLLFYSSITKETRKAETLEDIIDDVLVTLRPREQRIIGLRFGLEDGRSRTLGEVGKEFGLTGERIRQIEAISLRKLRHPSRSRLLRTILGSMSDLDITYQRLLVAIFGSDWQQYIATK